MQKTKIEWTDATDNPIRTADGSFYCFKVSEGCKFCYAEVVARWIAGMRHATPEPYTERKQYPELKLHREILAGWAKKTTPRKRFVSSMTDIAGEFVPDSWFFEILDAMAAAPLQTFQILSKRAERFADLCIAWIRRRGLPIMPHNIWPGLTVENQIRADERIPHLLRIPSIHRWLSIEPMVGPVDLSRWLPLRGMAGVCADINGEWWHAPGSCPQCRPSIPWIVVGGESGSNARPPRPEWFLSLRDQALRRGVAFFFKQWGEWYPEMISAPGRATRIAHVDPRGKICSAYKPPTIGAIPMYRVGKKIAPALLEGVSWHQFPQ